MAIPHPPTLIRTYTPRPSAIPLPSGRISIIIGQSKQYLGRDAKFGENQGLPVIRIKATIHIETAQDRSEGKVGKKIGVIEGWVVQVGRLDNEQTNFWEVCKRISAEMYTMARMLFDQTAWFKPELLRPSMQSQPFGDILYVDTVNITETYRGHGLGLLALRGLIDHLPSFLTDLVIFPIIPKPRTSTSSKTTSEKAKNRLSDYWSLLGFEHWSTDRLDKKTGVPYFGMSTIETRYPSAREVVPHFFEAGLDEAFESPQYPAAAGELDEVTTKETQGKSTRRIVRRVNVKGLLGGETSFEALTGIVDTGYPRGYLSLTINKRKLYLGWAVKYNRFPIGPLQAKIRYERDIQLGEPGAVVGKIDAWLIRKEHITKQKLDFHKACTAHSSELGDFAKALYDKHGGYEPFKEYSEAYLPGRANYAKGDILYIKHVELKKRYRGYGLARLAIHTLIKSLPSFETDCIVLVIPSIAPSTVDHALREIQFYPWSAFVGPTNGINYFGTCTVVHQIEDIRDIIPIPFRPRGKEDQYGMEDDESDTELEYAEEEGLKSEGRLMMDYFKEVVQPNNVSYSDLPAVYRELDDLVSSNRAAAFARMEI